ncbi:MAG: hypothetical protein HOD92_10535 [Deltaproteobacteria bacterium]|jgi:hypothetical protein|nr:hypothetical protein [Deltaproteobacteria bacterium]MBT4525417.1 hypothetical protein [Deltaproteobacteria bacterium]
MEAIEALTLVSGKVEHVPVTRQWDQSNKLNIHNYCIITPLHIVTSLWCFFGHFEVNIIHKLQY